MAISTPLTQLYAVFYKLHTVLHIIKSLSVQCYAWTEYKFTCMCVCVSVCVSITFSVNSPTGQTPQRIFTVDSLKDADLRRMCLLGS